MELPNIVEQTSIFDRKELDARLKAQSLKKLQLAQISLKYLKRDSQQQHELNQLTETTSLLNKDLEDLDQFAADSIVRKQADYKCMLKCLRIWKIHTKQQIYKRQQQKFIDISRISNMYSELQSELEYSREVTQMLDEFAIARNHYNNYLLILAFKGLVGFVASFRNQKNKVEFGQRQTDQKIIINRMFKAWRKLTVQEIQRRQLILMVQQIKFKTIYVAFKNQCKHNQQQISQALKECNLQRDLNQKFKVFQILLKNLEEGKRKLEQVNIDQVRSARIKKQVLKILEQQNPEARQIHVGILSQIRKRNKQRVVQRWFQIAKDNQRIRYLYQNIHCNHILFSKRINFKAWLQLQKQFQLATQTKRATIMRKTLKLIQQNCQLKKRNKQLTTKSIRQIEIVRMKIVMSIWKKYVSEIQHYRSFQLEVYNKFDLFKQRQVFKQWFNQVDILKRWRYLNQNTYQLYFRKQKKRVFKAWKREIRLRVSYFTVNDNRNYNLALQAIQALRRWTQVSRKAKFVMETVQQKQRHFVIAKWYGMLNEKLRLRLKMQKRRDVLILEECFVQLREYCYRRQDFKQGMKSLLQLRARNVLRIAFVKGLKQAWHSRVITLNLLKAASVFRHLKLKNRVISSFRKNTAINNKLKLVQSQTQNAIKSSHFAQWFRLYIRQDAVNRYQAIQSKRILRLVFHSLFQAISRRKNQRRLVLFQQKVSENNRLKFVFRKLDQYRIDKKNRKQYYKSLVNRVYRQNLKQLSFKLLKEHTNKRTGKRRKQLFYSDVGNKLIKRKVLKALALKSQMKKKQFKMQTQIVVRIKRNCLGALIKNQTINVAHNLVAAKRQARSKFRVLDGLNRYRAYRKHCKQFRYQSTVFYSNSIFKKVLFSFKNHAHRNRQLACAYKLTLEKRVIKHFTAWLDESREAQQFRIQRLKARHMFTSKYFFILKAACLQSRDSQSRLNRLNLRRLQIAFYNKNSKKRVLRQFLKFKVNSQISSIHQEFVLKVRLRTLYCAWVQTVRNFKRKRILKDSADIMSKNSKLEKALTSLRIYSDTRIKNKLIVERFQERQEMALKVDILLALHNNVAISKQTSVDFYQKVVFLAERRIADPFLKWMEHLFELRLQDRADKFFRSRKAQYLFRISWDSLKVYSLHSKQKSNQYKAIEGWHNKMKMQRVLLAFKFQTHQNQRLDNVKKIIEIQSNQVELSKFFKGFKNGVDLIRIQNAKKSRSVNKFKQFQMRKTLNGLKKIVLQQRKTKQIVARRAVTVKRECMLKWIKGMVLLRRLKAFTQILQREQDCRLAYDFFPSLVKQTYTLQIIDHLTQKRRENLQIEFFNILRKQILIKKILTSFQNRNKLKIMRAILVELQIHSQKKQSRKIVIGCQLTEIEEEQDHDVMQIAFNSLKEHVVANKFKSISHNCFRLKTIRNCFGALQRFEISQKIQKKKADEIKKIQEAKYFCFWHKAFLKMREQKQATDYMENTFMFQVMTAWKAQTCKQLRSRSFRKNVVQRNKQRDVLNAWKLLVEIRKRNQQLANYISMAHRSNIQAKYFLNWLSQLSRDRIELNMANYSILNLQSKVFKAWKIQTDTKNMRRAQMYRIKQQFQQKPQLSRPLKVLKNMLLFKAFNKLAVGAKQSRNEEYILENAQFAYFMQLQKKTFLGLKLATQIQVKEQQTTEIGRLILKKRFFEIIKKGTFILQHRRKLRHKASIFRFLSLQRKAIQSFKKYKGIVQENTLKNEFAYRFYYSSIIHKSFSCLKINLLQAKEKSVNDQSENNIQVGTSLLVQIQKDSLLENQYQIDDHRIVHSAEKSTPLKPRAIYLNEQTKYNNSQRDLDFSIVPQMMCMNKVDSSKNHSPDNNQGTQKSFQDGDLSDVWYQKQYLDHRNQQIQLSNQNKNQMTAAEIYPSMSAINQTQTSAGYNIFNNISPSASGIITDHVSGRRESVMSNLYAAKTQADQKQDSEFSKTVKNSFKNGYQLKQDDTEQSNEDQELNSQLKAYADQSSDSIGQIEKCSQKQLDYQQHFRQTNSSESLIASCKKGPPQKNQCSNQIVRIDQFINVNRQTDHE